MKSGLFLPWSLLVGLFLLTSNAEAARATTLILGKSKPEPKIDIPPTGEEENLSVSVAGSTNLSNETINVGNVTKLTGVPQIDYIYDPNLPRELNGYNLTDYPFYNSVPEDIDFKCDGLHDGFYASVPHKCQVYHHCLFGTRYDFLCANYTAFDQKTFICHFASEVDCKNSPKYFNRNEALYKAATTTTISPFGSSGLAGRRPQQDSPGGRRRRPFSRKRKPSYEYYDEYEDAAADDDYYDDASATGRKRKRPRPFSGRDSYDDVEEEGQGDKGLPPSAPNKSVYDRPRIAPKIRRPVPVNERDKYDYSSDSRVIAQEPVVEKKKFEDAESSNRKQASNRAPDYYEPTGSKYSKNVEPNTEREREREHKEPDDYDERERERARDRERERERNKERDDRPYRDRRPPKKRRRPDDLDDEYDEYEDVRRYRNRNRPRYEEYDDYEYDERPYRSSQRNRDLEYRLRDHEYDRDKPYRSRDSDYDRPRNRDRIRDDDRPIRNREIDDRPPRIRDDDRPPRNRDEDRPVRNRDLDKPGPKDVDDRSRNRNEQPYRNDGKNKNKNRDDDRQYYKGDEDRYRDRGADEGKRSKDIYREEPPALKNPEEDEKQYKHKESESSQDEPDKYTRQQDRNRNQDRPPRYRDNLDKFAKNRTPSWELPVEVEEPKPKPELNNFNGKQRPAEQTERSSFRNSDRGTFRPGNVQRTRVPVTSQDIEGANLEEQNKPVPASRPAYITKPSEAVTLPTPRKSFNEPNGRKTNSFKRPFLPRVPLVQDDSFEQQEKPVPLAPELPVQTGDRFEERPYDRPKFQEDDRYSPENKEQTKYTPPAEIRGAIELNDKLQPVAAEEPSSEYSSSRLKVPQEDSKEELAPRAPKFPQTSPRRRPFLPSRNGNPNLPRNLLPVGVKALQAPRGFQIPNKATEEEKESKPEAYPENPEKERQDSKYKITNNGGGVEFRAKVSTAIGVDQPKLTQFFQDVQSSSELELPEYEENPQSSGPSSVDTDYYSNAPQKQENQDQPRTFLVNPALPPQRQVNTQDLSSSHMVPEYNRNSGQAYRQENGQKINFRPTLKPTDFPQLSISDAPPAPAPVQEERNIEQPFRSRAQLNQQPPVNNFPPKTATLFQPPPPPKSLPIQQQQQSNQQSLPPQLGPQSFYSENPKFKTTIKVPEPFPYKPPGSGLNFNPNTQVPAFQSGIRQSLPQVKPEPLRYENAQRQIDPPQENVKHLNLKFPPQNENLDETDEYDVSLNDALQPISTLHPRNVPTGVFLSNWQRNQQQGGGFKRRIHQGGSPSRPVTDPEEFNGRRQEVTPRVAAETRYVPNQQRNQKIVSQRQAASNVNQRYVHPPVYHPVRPVTNPGKYFAILTQ